MDLRQYFRKLAEVEAAITEEYPVVTSLETEDGGKAGAVSEVTRQIAAKLIVEGRAALASEKEKKAFHDEIKKRREAAKAAEAAKRLHIAIMSKSELPVIEDNLQG